MTLKGIEKMADKATRLSLSLALSVLACGAPLHAEPLSAELIKSSVQENTSNAVALYREFLSLPNDAQHPDDIDALLTWMDDAFSSRGFKNRRISMAGNDVLLAERMTGADNKTVLVYLQADGQPVDRDAWDQADPFLAVLKEQGVEGRWSEIPWERMELGIDADWRVFARSASDSKGPMTQFLVAMELLDAAGFEADYNLKVLVDTEEEMGSPHLAAAIAANRKLFAADMLLIFDGPPHASNKPTVSFGARGIATLTLTTYGPKVAQHSGHYGNFIPNPVFHLSRLLASMKSDDGVVQIAGFYDGIELSDDTRAILDAVPDDEAEILAAAGVARADTVGDSLQEALQYPSLNVRGMQAAWVGPESRTIIPPKAVAEIDMRLVTESDPERLVALVREHIKEQGYLVLDREPSDAERSQHPRIATLTYSIAYGAFRSDFDTPAGQMARKGMRHLYGEEPILIRSMGGSIPIAPIIEALDLPAATVPTVNIDNNQHSPNENLRLGNFLAGIEILMAVLSQDTAPDPEAEAVEEASP
jgi:acetylornithine deacetylase/succinyl-diaminopimelate desuccinylase-like protein